MAQAELDEDDLMMCVSGLGSAQKIDDGEQIYVPGEECLACLNDLQRYLRRDSPKEMAAHIKLGKWSVAKTHLLPMLISQAHDQKLVFNVLKLLVKLTMPVGHEQFSEDMRDVDEKGKKKKGQNPLAVVGRNLQGAIDTHREAFSACTKGVRVIMRILVDPLRQSVVGGAESDDDNVFIELVLTLFRNLMHTPPPDAALPDAMEALAFKRTLDAHARLLAVLESEAVFDLVLYISQLLTDSAATRSWNLTLLEVLYCIISFTDPDEVVHAAKAAKRPSLQPARQRASASAAGEGEAPARPQQPQSRIALHLEREKASRNARDIASTVRHSNFGGAFECLTGFGSRMIVGKVAEGAGGDARGQAQHGQRHKSMAAKQPVLEERVHVAVGTSRATLLLEFARQMLRGPFGALMLTVRKDLHDAQFGSTNGNARRVLAADYVYFCAVSAWFCDMHRALEDQRLASSSAGSFDVTHVAISCELPCWQMALRLAREHIEGHNWLKLGVVVRFLRSLVQVVDKMATRGDKEARRIAHALFQNVFYEGEYMTLLAQVHKAYEPHLMGVSFLRDTIELVHVSLRNLESYCKDQGGIVLQRRRAKNKKRKATAAAEAAAVVAALEGAPGADSEEVAEAAAAAAATTAAAAAAAAAAEDDDDEQGDVAVVEEVTLDFERSLLELMHNQIVWKYCLALKSWRTNPVRTNHAVARFLHRVIKQCRLEPVLWQVRILQIAHDVITDREAKRAEHEELMLLCERIAKGFLEAARASAGPQLLVEALFTKKHSECEELRTGFANSRGRADIIRESEAAIRERAVFDEQMPEALAGGESSEEEDCLLQPGDEGYDDGNEEDEPDAADEGAGGEEERGDEDAPDEGAEPPRARDGSSGKERKKKRAHREPRAEKVAWEPEEDAALADNYELYAELGAEVYDVLASMLDDRSAKDVRKRVKRLGLASASGGGGGEAPVGRTPLVVAGAEGASSDDDDVLNRRPKRRAAEAGATELGGGGGDDGNGVPEWERELDLSGPADQGSPTLAPDEGDGGEPDSDSAERRRPRTPESLSAARTHRRPSQQARAGSPLRGGKAAEAARPAPAKRLRVVEEDDDESDGGAVLPAAEGTARAVADDDDDDDAEMDALLAAAAAAGHSLVGAAV